MIGKDRGRSHQPDNNQVGDTNYKSTNSSVTVDYARYEENESRKFKRRILIFGILLLALLVAAVVKIYHVNSTAPHLQHEVHGLNEWVDLSRSFFDSKDADQRDGYYFMITDLKVVSEKQFFEQIAHKPVPEQVNTTDKSIVAVKLRIKNEGCPDALIATTDLHLVPESQVSTLLIDDELVKETVEKVPEDGLANIAIRENTEYEAWFPFTSNGIVGDRLNYSHPDSYFELVVGFQPVRQVIHVNVDKDGNALK